MTFSRRMGYVALVGLVLVAGGCGLLAEKDLIRIADLTPADLQRLLDLSAEVVEDPHGRPDLLGGDAVVCYFAKPSTRTRLSFGSAIAHLGGVPEMVSGTELQLGRGETIEDTAGVISRYARAFVIRTFADEDVRRFAGAATIPVINLETLPFIATVVLLFAGMEMAGFHALEVRNPQKDFPKAMVISALIIFSLTVVGTLAIAIVVPASQLSLAAGLMQAFQAFLTAFNLEWLLAPLALLVALGGIALLQSWLTGPALGLGEVANRGLMPPFFTRIAKRARRHCRNNTPAEAPHACIKPATSLNSPPGATTFRWPGRVSATSRASQPPTR